MAHQSIIALCVSGMSLGDLGQAVADHKLVEGCCEQSCGDIDQYGDPRVAVVVREGFFAEEDGGNDAGAQISGRVGGDRVDCETPDHCCIHQPDGEGHANGRDEGICRIQASPDHHPDEAIDHEFLEEEVALIRLVWIRE